MEIPGHLGVLKNLTNLPAEMLLNIFSMVTPEDISTLSETCEQFKKIIKEHENQLWAKVCLNYYQIEIPSTNGYAKRFYNNVLKPYGHLIGFWTLDLCGHIQHGGLLHIQYRDDQLIGQDLQLPRWKSNGAEPLRPKTLFRIFMEEEKGDKAVIKCCLNLATSQRQLDLQYSLGHFVLKHIGANVNRDYSKEVRERIRSLQNENDQVKNSYMDEHFFFDVVRDGGVAEWTPRYNPDYPCDYLRLEFPMKAKFTVPMRQGLFRVISVCSDQDQIEIAPEELVMLDYLEDKNTALGIHITWNRNNLGNAWKFKADLSKCLVLLPFTQDVQWETLPPQPFVVPQIYQEKFPDLPTECMAKFQGFADLCFYDNELEFSYEGHWIIFNENLMAFLNNYDDGSRRPILTVFYRQDYPGLQ